MLIAHQQIEHFRSKDLGFKRQELLLIPNFQFERSLSPHYKAIKEAFLQHPDVLSAAACWLPPGRANPSDMAVMRSEFTGREVKIPMIFVGPDFVEAYGIQIIIWTTFRSYCRSRFDYHYYSKGSKAIGAR